MTRGMLILLAGLAGLGQLSRAQDVPPTCPPGCKIVEEIVNKEQVRFCSKIVPNIRIKWVYDCAPDAYTIPRTHGHHCDKCLECKTCPRNLLVKKPVEECIGQKCVTERIVEIVPCKVYRIVPCGDGVPSAEPIPAPKVIVPDGK